MKWLEKILKTSLAMRITLVDQMLVSGANFLTGIIITRLAGLEVYGYFALAWMGIMLANSLQQSLIITPMMSLSPKMEPAEKKDYFLAAQNLQLIFSILVLLITFLLVAVSDTLFSGWAMSELIWVLPLAIAGFVLQDFYRKYFFVHGKPAAALVMDIIGYLGMMAGLVLLHFTSGLSVRLAYGVVGGCFFLSAIVGVIMAGIPFQINTKGPWTLSAIFIRHWKYSSWLVGTSFLQFFSSNYFLIAAGGLLGNTAVGALRIAQNILGATHVIFLAMENSVPFKAAGAFKKDGLRGMYDYLRLVSLKSGLLVLMILAGIAVSSGYLLLFVYGPEYAEYSYLLIAYCVFYAFIFPAYPLRFALRTLEYTQPIFISYVLSTVLSLLLAYPMVGKWGLMGVIYGLILVQTVMQICYVTMLRHRIRTRLA